MLLGAAQAAEPIYGPTEFFKLITVAATACGTTSFLLQYAWFFFHLSASALFAEHAGFYGVQGALFVAIKHVMPGQDITLLPGVALPTRFLPGVYILLLSLISIVTGNLTGLRFAVVGTFAGWLYLRFFKPSGLDGANLSSQPAFPFTAYSCAAATNLVACRLCGAVAQVRTHITMSHPRQEMSAIAMPHLPLRRYSRVLQATAASHPARP